MPAITEETTVGELARLWPGSIPLLEQYGIDFCCGGSRHLGQACQERGIGFSDFLKALNEASQAAGELSQENWDTAPLTKLIEHILDRHHGYLQTELPRLQQQIDKIIEVHGAQHGDVLHPLGKAFSTLRAELTDHLWKEENVLFPLIRRLAQAHESGDPTPPVSVADSIRVMEYEHRSTGHGLEKIYDLTKGFQTPPDACATYQAVMRGLQALTEDIHRHIHLENNILFPRAQELES
jgi:regulator of cell morphogenesis and NO signaling